MRFVLLHCLRLFFPVCVLLTASNCASTYVQNRISDAGDIFTVELQTQSYGLAVRAGPIKAGLSYKSPDGYAVGLRGGRAGSHQTEELTLLLFGSDSFKRKVDAPEKDQGPGKSQNAKDQTSLPDPRQKEFDARSPFGTKKSMQKTKSVLKGKTEFAPPYYYTQIEITVGIYFGIKLGINPGELLDFILGFVGIDIMGDDLPDAGPNPTQPAADGTGP
ncbi:MAG: hypothetical protein HY042_09085 [Spirochaetia bacterium]|nr:hypothetical protein [Spirochaetia bacterium]